MTLVFVFALLWAVAWLLTDALYTSKGLKAGIALEGNGLIDAIFRSQKPSLWQRLLVDGTIRAALAASYFLPTKGAPPHTWHVMSVVTLTVIGILNIRGARQWRWMFAHPGRTIPQLDTFWQKFFGFWG